MGQKVHPVGFRLGLNKTWSSIWFADDRQTYVKNIHNDIAARKYIFNTLKNAGVADVIIKRALNYVLIEIYVARPGMVIGKGGKGMEELKKVLDVKMETDVRLEVREIKNPGLESRIVAQNIADGIKKRISPKFLMSKELEKIKEAGALGGKIAISGLIGGSAIHRTEKRNFGTLPLHTLRADISYSAIDVLNYNSGIMGIKVWIFKGEKSSYEQ